VHAMKAKGRRGGIALLNFKFGARWRWVVTVTRRPLYPRARTPVPIKAEAGFSPEPLWMYLQMRKSVPTGIRTPVRPTCGSVRTLTTLP